MSIILDPLHHDYEDPYSFFNLWYNKDTVTITIPTGSITNSDITLYLDALQSYTILYLFIGIKKYSGSSGKIYVPTLSWSQAKQAHSQNSKYQQPPCCQTIHQQNHLDIISEQLDHRPNCNRDFPPNEMIDTNRATKLYQTFTHLLLIQSIITWSRSVSWSGLIILSHPMGFRQGRTSATPLLLMNSGDTNTLQTLLTVYPWRRHTPISMPSTHIHGR